MATPDYERRSPFGRRSPYSGGVFYRPPAPSPKTEQKCSVNGKSVSIVAETGVGMDQLKAHFQIASDTWTLSIPGFTAEKFTKTFPLLIIGLEDKDRKTLIDALNADPALTADLTALAKNPILKTKMIPAEQTKLTALIAELEKAGKVKIEFPGSSPQEMEAAQVHKLGIKLMPLEVDSDGHVKMREMKSPISVTGAETFAKLQTEAVAVQAEAEKEQESGEAEAAEGPATRQFGTSIEEIPVQLLPELLMKSHESNEIGVEAELLNRFIEIFTESEPKIDGLNVVALYDQVQTILKNDSLNETVREYATQLKSLLFNRLVDHGEDVSASQDPVLKAYKSFSFSPDIQAHLKEIVQGKSKSKSLVLKLSEMHSIKANEACKAAIEELAKTKTCDVFLMVDSKKVSQADIASINESVKDFPITGIGFRGQKKLTSKLVSQLQLDTPKKALTTISLVDCHLGDKVAKAFIERLPKTIQSLDLGENNLTSGIIPELKKFESLRGLSLSGNQMGRKGIEALRGMPFLGKLTGFHLNNFGLNLSGSKTRDEMKGLLQSMPSVQKLSLSGNDFSGKGLSVLSDPTVSLPNLRILSLKFIGIESGVALKGISARSMDDLRKVLAKVQDHLEELELDLAVKDWHVGWMKRVWLGPVKHPEPLTMAKLTRLSLGTESKKVRTYLASQEFKERNPQLVLALG